MQTTTEMKLVDIGQLIDGELVINGKLIIGENAEIEGLAPIPTVISSSR